MAVYTDIYWSYSDNGVLHSIDHVKIDDTFSKEQLENFVVNGDNESHIKQIEQALIDYIKNTKKHNFYHARIVDSILPDGVIDVMSVLEEYDARTEEEKEL